MSETQDLNEEKMEVDIEELNKKRALNLDFSFCELLSQSLLTALKFKRYGVDTAIARQEETIDSLIKQCTSLYASSGDAMSRDVDLWMLEYQKEKLEVKYGKEEQQ